VRYLLDTNVVSEMRRIQTGKGDPAVERWANNVQAMDMHLSAITVEELEIGVLRVERRDPFQGRLLRVWLNGYALPAFAGRIISIDVEIALRSAQFHIPDPHLVRDGLIAATALLHGMTVVTRNTAGFEPTGVRLLNPWLP
jgi:toxin FitB